MTTHPTIDGLLLVLTPVAALGCGLMAGVFFAFSGFVMTALARLPPAHGIAAMQSINVAVLNPLFMAALFGTAGVCVLLSALALSMWNEPGAVYLLAGGVLYLVGAILVTMARNVPLNNALKVVEPASVQGASLWTRYLTDWTAWNHVRTAACLAAALSFTIALCYLDAAP